MRCDSRATLDAVVLELIQHPIWLVRRWNYKAAITSALIRGSIFLVANMTSGFTAATAAASAEFALHLITSGFYGAVTQALSRVEPARAGMLAAVIVLPIAAHALEFLVHWSRGTPSLAVSMLLSLALTGLSTSFNVFAMRRGVLVVGEGPRRSLADDFRIMPIIIRAFVRSASTLIRPVACWRSRSIDLRP